MRFHVAALTAAGLLAALTVLPAPPTSATTAATSAAAAARSGDLDRTFGYGGRIDVRGLDNTNTVDLMVLPDGRLQTTGRERVLRLTAAGQPDQSFGVSGVVPIPAGLVNAAGGAVDAQGRTLVAGSFQPGGDDRTALLRLLPDGSPDPSFGGDGIVDVSIQAGTETAQTVLVQPDGKYVLVGTVGFEATEQAAVLRLLPNGTPDPAFAGDGSLVLGPSRAEADQAVLTGSSVLVSGYEHPASSSTPAAGFVARVRGDGTLDPAFSGDGIAFTPPRVGLTTADLVVLPDGRVRQVGASGVEGDLDLGRGVLSGFTATGAPDPAVGPGGQRVYDVTPGRGTLFATLALSGSTLVVAGGADGRVDGGTVPHVGSLIGRLTLDGAPVRTFAGDGFATGDANAFAVATRVRLDAAGRILTAGWVSTDLADGRFSTRVARYVAADPPAPNPPPSAASVIRLPAAKRCVAPGTKVRLRVTPPSGTKVAKVTAKVGRARTRTVHPPVRLALKGRPKAKVKVLVTARLSTGVTLRRSVTYRICAR